MSHVPLLKGFQSDMVLHIKENTESFFKINELPDDLILKIFSFLSSFQKSCIPLVSKRFQELGKLQSIQNEIFEKRMSPLFQKDFEEKKESVLGKQETGQKRIAFQELRKVFSTSYCQEFYELNPKFRHSLLFHMQSTFILLGEKLLKNNELKELQNLREKMNEFIDSKPEERSFQKFLQILKVSCYEKTYEKDSEFAACVSSQTKKTISLLRENLSKRKKTLEGQIENLTLEKSKQGFKKLEHILTASICKDLYESDPKFAHFLWGKIKNGLDSHSSLVNLSKRIPFFDHLLEFTKSFDSFDEAIKILVFEYTQWEALSEKEQKSLITQMKVRDVASNTCFGIGCCVGTTCVAAAAIILIGFLIGLLEASIALDF